MPYIEQKDRNEKFGDLTTENLRLGYACETPGDLNYVITLICQQYLKSKGLRYQYVNDIIGALEGCKLEFYRRIVSNYEDEKINLNGDVNIL